ncbi:unnamed protein product [Litomosoides sigmodontis]|uniref:Uncharacterized protein n=1 Tax=Litomosoides sigmodontis TaxID=42156 RepID=A0A3P6TJ46_LITSI|nr:unnamed protein product [Litomosoides sigmodontis]
MNKMAADPSVYPKLSSASIGAYEGRLSCFADYHMYANRHRSAPLINKKSQSININASLVYSNGRVADLMSNIALIIDKAIAAAKIYSINQNSITKSRTMPYPSYKECCENSLPNSRCSANVLADCLKSSPLYHQQESERWGHAINFYQDMMSNRDQCCTSPPNSPVNLGTLHTYPACGASLSACDSSLDDTDNTCTIGSLNGSLMGLVILSLIRSVTQCEETC